MKYQKIILIAVSVTFGILISLGIKNWLVQDLWNSIENSFVEYSYRMQALYSKSNASPVENFLLVDIDAESMAMRNRRFTRTDLMHYLGILSEYNPRCIIVDLSQLDYRGDSLEDISVAQELADIRNIGLTGLLFSPEHDGDLLGQKSRYIDSIALPMRFPTYLDAIGYRYWTIPDSRFLQSAAFFGFAHCAYAENTRCSHVGLLLKYRNLTLPSICLAAYCYLKGIPAHAIKWDDRGLRIGTILVPMEKAGLRLAPWRMYGNFKRLEIFKLSAFPGIGRSEIEGKIVIVGSSSQNDWHVTQARSRIWGSEILAMGLNQLLQERYVVKVDPSIIWAIAIMNALIVSVLILSRFHILGLVWHFLSFFTLMLASCMILPSGKLLNPFWIVFTGTACIIITYLLKNSGKPLRKKYQSNDFQRSNT